MGINVVLPPYLYHVSGLSLAASAGLSIIFTLTGTLGQVIWPWLSDSFGRKRTLIVCGLWMSIGIALFYFATNMPRLIAIQLFFGLVANAVWPIYYAMASDSAEERATSTANGIITTAMFIGGGIRHCLWAGSFSLAAAGKIQRVISTPSLPWRDVRCWGCYYSS